MILAIATTAPTWGYVITAVVSAVAGAYGYKWFANKFDAAVKAAVGAKS